MFDRSEACDLKLRPLPFRTGDEEQRCKNGLGAVTRHKRVVGTLGNHGQREASAARLGRGPQAV